MRRVGVKETEYCPNGAQHGGDGPNAFLESVNLFRALIRVVIKPCFFDGAAALILPSGVVPRSS